MIGGDKMKFAIAITALIVFVGGITKIKSYC